MTTVLPVVSERESPSESGPVNSGKCLSHHACARSELQLSLLLQPHAILNSTSAFCGRLSGSFCRHARTSSSSSRRNRQLRPLRRRYGFGLHVLEKHLHRRIGLEDELAGQQVVRDAAERVDIGSPIDGRFAQDDFRRHVGRACRSSLFGGHQGLHPLVGWSSFTLTRPKSSTFTKSVLESHPADIDICRFDVAVNQPARVRIGQRMADLPQQIARPRRWNRSELAHQRFEIAAHQQFHDVIEDALVGRCRSRTAWIVCGELRAAVACASRSKRLSISLASASLPAPSTSGRTSLTAALRASRRCWASHTSPMPAMPEQSHELDSCPSRAPCAVSARCDA